MKTKFSELTLDEINDLTFIPPFKVGPDEFTDSDFRDYGVDLVNAVNVWHVTKGHGVKVAVLDTGVEESHPDLKDGIKDCIDFTLNNDCSDNYKHGTHIAGIIGARENGEGIVGVAPECDLYIGKVMDKLGSAKVLAEAIYYAVDIWEVDVINISAGTVDHHQGLHEAIHYAQSKGKFIICAAGNRGAVGAIDYPAKYSETISIGAIDRTLNLRGTSSKGCELDFVAPGDNILSAYPGQTYRRLSGTSMAAPFASGLVALLIAKHSLFNNSRTPIRNVFDLKEHIRKVSIDLGPRDYDMFYGDGLIRIV